MKIMKKISRRIGNRLEIDWDEIPFKEFHMGMNVELEHGNKLGKKTNVTGNSPMQTGRIALAHLEEDPRYYSKLKKMEKGKQNKSLKEYVKLIVESIIDEEFDIEELIRLSKKGAGEESSITPSSEGQSSEKLDSVLQQKNAVNILKYAEENLEYINSGNARQVFLLPDKKSVLKIAYQSNRVKESDLGIQQNKNEVDVSRKEGNNPLLTKVLNWDENGYKWIVTEYVTPIDPNSDKFSKVTGIPEDFFYIALEALESNSSIEDSKELIEVFIEDYKNRLVEIDKLQTEYWRKNDNLDDSLRDEKDNVEQAIELLEEMKKESKITTFLDQIIDFIHRNKGILIPDIARIEHWGLDASDKIKLYDYGGWTSQTTEPIK